MKGDSFGGTAPAPVPSRTDDMTDVEKGVHEQRDQKQVDDSRRAMRRSMTTSAWWPLENISYKVWSSMGC